ncbi:MAG: hypothetical protein OXF74_08525 [Rhodobacteraceae bacterium]|nr:hypothetical protein [Paracoccaceae bacterium]
MKNIILQHYSGKIQDVQKLSIQNIEKYAESQGAEYRFLEGSVFDSSLSPPMQKLVMLDSQFDSYDTVVMVDTDMFTRAGMEDSIFDQVGIGVSADFQRRLKWSLIRKRKGLVHWKYPYWGGSVWKLSLFERQMFRSNLHKVNLRKFSEGLLEDEGVMHWLAYHSKFKGGILPDNNRWSWPSYLPGIERASLIHVRTKVRPKGPERDKIENLIALKDHGLIN